MLSRQARYLQWKAHVRQFNRQRIRRQKLRLQSQTAKTLHRLRSSENAGTSRASKVAPASLAAIVSAKASMQRRLRNPRANDDVDIEEYESIVMGENEVGHCVARSTVLARVSDTESTDDVLLQALDYPVFRDPVDDFSTPVPPEYYIKYVFATLLLPKPSIAVNCVCVTSVARRGCRWRLQPMLAFYQKRLPGLVRGRTVCPTALATWPLSLALF